MDCFTEWLDISCSRSTETFPMPSSTPQQSRNPDFLPLIHQSRSQKIGVRNAKQWATLDGNTNCFISWVDISCSRSTETFPDVFVHTPTVPKSRYPASGPPISNTKDACSKRQTMGHLGWKHELFHPVTGYLVFSLNENVSRCLRAHSNSPEIPISCL